MTDIEPLKENNSFNLANKSNLSIIGGAHAALNICDKVFTEHFIVIKSLVHDVNLGEFHLEAQSRHIDVRQRTKNM
jgi:hypothetical protein